MSSSNSEQDLELNSDTSKEERRYNSDSDNNSRLVRDETFNSFVSIDESSANDDTRRHYSSHSSISWRVDFRENQQLSPTDSSRISPINLAKKKMLNAQSPESTIATVCSSSSTSSCSHDGDTDIDESFGNISTGNEPHPPPRLERQISSPRHDSRAGLRHRDYIHQRQRELNLEKYDSQFDSSNYPKSPERKPSKPILPYYNDDHEDFEQERHERIGSGCDEDYHCHLHPHDRWSSTLPSRYGANPKNDIIERKMARTKTLLYTGSLTTIILLLTAWSVHKVAVSNSDKGHVHAIKMEGKRLLMEERQIIMSSISKTRALIEENRKISKNSMISDAQLEGYSIRIHIDNPGRWDLLDNVLDAHSHCTMAKNVQVEVPSKWNKNIPKNVSNHSSGKVVVGDYEQLSKQRLDEGAVLLLSDDVVFTCEELHRAYQVWSRRPDRIVGFYPFHAESGHSDSHSFLSSEPSTSLKIGPRSLEHGDYSLVSDRAAFVHSAYLNRPKYLADDPLCQRLALSIRVTSLSLSPPIAVAADPLDLKKSTESDWFKGEKGIVSVKSADCLVKVISEHYLGDLPAETRIFLGE